MMNRFFLLACLAACIGTLSGAPVRAAAALYPQDGSDLKVDPAVHWGRLDNGVRYAVMQNPQPKGRISIRLVVLSGALNEREEQRGLAHFVEHEAFNGSSHFPPGTLVKYFQRLGMSFGGDTNAMTLPEQTIYQLELPDSELGTLNEAITLIGDYARGIQFEPAVIDKERGIILGEQRARDSVGARAYEDELKFLFPGSRISERMPIGLIPVIQEAQRPLLQGYYDAWYRPDNLWVVIVGDVDAGKAEQAVRAGLKDAIAKGPAPTRPPLDQVTPHSGLLTRLHTDPEASVTSISVLGIGPYQDEADTGANRIKQLPRDLAMAMLNRRLALKTKEEGSPITGGGASVEEGFHFYRQLGVTVNSEPAHWREALGVADQELRRALEHGFEADELNEIVASVRNSLEQAVLSAATRTSPELAEGLVGSINENNVFTTPATDRALILPALEKLTPEDCAQALRNTWTSTPNRYIYISGNLQLADPEKEITAAYEASHSLPVAARAALTTDAFAYTDFGTPGAVKTRRHVKDLDVTLVEYRNGVRLNLKRTPFQADTVEVGIRIGAGRLTQPKSEPGLAIFASGIFLPGGLGRHDADELSRIFAGKSIGSDFGVGDDALLFRGQSSTRDLNLELELLAAHVTDPGYRAEAQREFRQQTDQRYLQIAHSVEGPLSSDLPRLLANGDPRFGLPAQNVMSARTLDEVKAWLGPQLSSGPIEISLVGDFDVEKAIAAVAHTFGTLPPRAAKPAYKNERRVDFPAQPLHLNYSVAADTPRGMVELAWPATDGEDAPRTRRLRLLANILGDRLRIKLREEMSATYSPGSSADLSTAFTGYGYLTASAVVAPTNARVVADAIATAAQELAAQGVSEDELKRALSPVLTQVRQSARDNQYWNTVLANAQEEPRQLQWARTRLADYKSISRAELSALAAQYYVPARASEVISLPTGAATTLQGAAATSSAGPSP